MVPRFLFRCDASKLLGGGHVMRCLTLADALAGRGAEITFACSTESFETVPALQASSHSTIVVGCPFGIGGLVEQAGRWDAAVIDHYGLGARQETALRKAARIILVIDDLADRPHDCDILIDQTVGRDPADYAALVGPATDLRLGAKYAMLRPEFALARPAALAARSQGRPVSRIFVSLGMTDVGGITAWAVKAALAAGLDAEIAVATGSRVTSLRELQALAAADRRVVLHIDCTDVAALMARSDIAIGAAGTTSWERCCLGLPSLLLVIAGNQEVIARNLARLGAAEVVPADDQLALTSSLARLAANRTVRHSMSEAASKVCDGEGSRRVAKLLNSATGESEVRLL